MFSLPRREESARLQRKKKEEDVALGMWNKLINLEEADKRKFIILVRCRYKKQKEPFKQNIILSGGGVRQERKFIIFVRCRYNKHQ